MPITEMKAYNQEKADYLVTLPTSLGIEVEVQLNLDWPGDAVWSGGRSEPWSLGIIRNPTFEIVSSVLCDGEDTPYNLSQKQVAKALELATEQYWETYE